MLRIKKRWGSPSPRVDYYLDESDPVVVVLRRQDGSYVPTFSAIRATREGVFEAAREDYAALGGGERGPSELVLRKALERRAQPIHPSAWK